MISLSLLKLLENNGLGTIDRDLFWQKMGLGKSGVYISSIGDARERGALKSQTYELYSKGDSDVSGYQKLLSIVEFLNNSYSSICTLPEVQGPNGAIITPGFDNVTIMPLSTISSNGEDAQGRVIWSATGQIIYN